MRRLLLLLLLMLASVAPVRAQSLISRTIAIDGSMADWMASPAIPSSPGQHSTDCQMGQACETDPVQSTGRDLKHFAYTWDNDNLYFYVERYASSSNTTTWLFYLDEDVDGKLEAGEHFFVVDWQGSNRSTNAIVCTYVPVAAGGDPLGGDGVTMPGTNLGPCTAVYYGQTGGSTTGVEMESRLPWSALGRTGPGNIAFHISSSRGLNLPTQIEDNMTGPGGSGGGGGQLFPPDMAVSLAASTSQLAGFQSMTLEVKLVNVYFDTYSTVRASVSLPTQVQYVSHAAAAGTAFVDSNTDGIPDQWQISTLGARDTVKLLITVRGKPIPTSVSTTSTATLTSWTGTDTQAGNNTATVAFTVQPSPSLIVTKTVSTATPTAVPGTLLTYTAAATNPTHAPAYFVVVTAALDSHLDFSLDAFGPGAPFQYVGLAAAGLSPGTVEYSADGGTNWTYAPVSGGGGAPGGFDAQVTHWRVTMTGTMASHGATFEVRYAARVR